MARQKSRPQLVDAASSPEPKRQNRVNLFDLAYQRIEDSLVNCALRPGRFLTMQDLQDLTGFGRTPVHNAVNRLAADTLILISPRHGLQIAPIDLARERVLLQQGQVLREGALPVLFLVLPEVEGLPDQSVQVEFGHGVRLAAAGS